MKIIQKILKSDFLKKNPPVLIDIGASGEINARWQELPPYYWVADIGVWPREESRSQIDALAYALPLILSNEIKVMARVKEDGLLFKEDDPKALSSNIIELQNAENRKQMAQYGLKKVFNNFSWEIIAKKRMEDYSDSLRGQ